MTAQNKLGGNESSDLTPVSRLCARVGLAESSTFSKSRLSNSATWESAAQQPPQDGTPAPPSPRFFFRNISPATGAVVDGSRSLPQDVVQYKYIKWHTSQLHMWPRDTSQPPNEIGFCYVVAPLCVCTFGDNIIAQEIFISSSVSLIDDGIAPRGVREG